jgi:glycosyltransferase involved in cell wall biosynthesis
VPIPASPAPPSRVAEPASTVPGLAEVDLCHAVGGGPAVLPGLLAKHFYGIPLIITEHSLHLRERARGYRDAPYRWPVRALLIAFFRLLAREGYQQAGLITPGSGYDRRWQLHCGADPDTIRVVYEGTEQADRPAAGAEPEAPTLAWSGPLEPRAGLEDMLQAFALLRAEVPEALLRVHGEARSGAEPYAEHCRALAGTLFPEDEDAVLFEGRPESLRTVHEGGTVLVFSGVDGPAPRLLAEAMLSGRPLVATDVGAAREVVGPTGLLVPAGDPRALAAACAALLRDQERRVRLGSAGRLRAQELYAVEPAATAFRELYLELVSHCPGPASRPVASGATRQPFSRPAELWAGAG